jgi:hypothetical protein
MPKFDPDRSYVLDGQTIEQLWEIAVWLDTNDETTDRYRRTGYGMKLMLERATVFDP